MDKLARRGLLSYRGQMLLFLAPFFLGTLVLVVLPALATVALAFTTYYGIAPPTWAGLASLQRVTENPLIRRSLFNSMVFLGLAVPLRLLGALSLALLLQRRQRGLGLYRAAVYIPTIIPEPAYALIWLWILNPVSGPLNILLGWLRLPTPAWLAEPTTAQLAMVLMALLQIGEGFVVLLAALQSVPLPLYEAAAVDGAGPWQSFGRITLPLIWPWLFLLLGRDLLVALQNTFTPTFMMTYGGPYYATTFVPLLVYELSFDYTDLGLASAVLLVTFVLIALLILGIYNVVEGLRGSVEET